jgi:3-hydroxyacyl-[acyl-carrier-protein] dehydratase
MTEQPVARGVVDTIDVMRIMEMIPHRYPFLMIDRVVDLVPDRSAIGIKNVSINESHFQGHFPRQPVMPGVLVIECMAQTAAVLVVETLEGEAAGKLVYFMTIEEGRFRKPVMPGDTLHIHVTKLRQRGNVWKFSGEARVEGTLMAQARFSAMIMDD